MCFVLTTAVVTASCPIQPPCILLALSLPQWPCLCIVGIPYGIFCLFWWSWGQHPASGVCNMQ